MSEDVHILPSDYMLLCKIRWLEAELSARGVAMEQMNGVMLAALGERDGLRASITRLNRRCQKAEAAVADAERLLKITPQEGGVRWVMGSKWGALLAYALNRESQILDWIATHWDSQCVGPQTLILPTMENVNGSFRDSVRAHWEKDNQPKQ